MISRPCMKASFVNVIMIALMMQQCWILQFITFHCNSRHTVCMLLRITYLMINKHSWVFRSLNVNCVFIRMAKMSYLGYSGENITFRPYVNRHRSIQHKLLLSNNDLWRHAAPQVWGWETISPFPLSVIFLQHHQITVCPLDSPHFHWFLYSLVIKGTLSVCVCH